MNSQFGCFAPTTELLAWPVAFLALGFAVLALWELGILGSDSNIHAPHPRGTHVVRWILDSDPNIPDRSEIALQRPCLLRMIDIQTKEIWFEAKDTGKCSSYAMFTQLLHYVQVALNKGEN